MAGAGKRRLAMLGVAVIAALLGAALPPWGRWLALALAGAFVFALGQMRGERKAGEAHLQYVAAQMAQGAKVVRARERVVLQTEVKWRERVRVIYANGGALEKEIPEYVTPSDNRRCIINAGFVRLHDAAWLGQPAGPAAGADRRPAAVSLADVAGADAFNATACAAWRAQALGWRAFYQQLRTAGQ